MVFSGLLNLWGILFGDGKPPSLWVILGCVPFEYLFLKARNSLLELRNCLQLVSSVAFEILYPSAICCRQFLNAVRHTRAAWLETYSGRRGFLVISWLLNLWDILFGDSKAPVLMGHCRVCAF